jgi:hypothetical protein
MAKQKEQTPPVAKLDEALNQATQENQTETVQTDALAAVTEITAESIIEAAQREAISIIEEAKGQALEIVQDAKDEAELILEAAKTQSSGLAKTVLADNTNTEEVIVDDLAARILKKAEQRNAARDEESVAQMEAAAQKAEIAETEA